MKFLAVLITIFFYRNWFGENPVQELVSFRRYQEWFVTRNLATNLRYILCVGIPTLIVLLLGVEFEDWFFGIIWLLLSLFVLTYAVEIYDSDLVLDEQITWLRALTDEDVLADVVQRHEDFLATTIYELFQSIVPVLFWFLVVGPAGAVFYALSVRYLDSLDLDDSEVDLLEQVIHWTDWIPASITGLLFALVGNFGRGFEYWLETFLDTEESNAVHLQNLALIVVDDDRNAEEDNVVGFAQSAEQQLNKLRTLFERTVYGWVGIAALVAIIGW